MAINGQVVIRPMMYLALSYDHRIIDGRESVGFPVRVKELLENPNSALRARPGKEPAGIIVSKTDDNFKACNQPQVFIFAACGSNHT